MVVEFRQCDTQEMVVLAAAIVDAMNGPMNQKQAARYLTRALRTISNNVSDVALNEIPHHKQMGARFSRAEIWKWIFSSKYGMTLRKAS